MLAAIAFLAQLTGATPCPARTFAPWAIDEWSRNIASVRSPHGAGFGVVVGWKPGEAWVAVPKHVVFGKEMPERANEFRSGLEVRLSGDREERLLCDSTSPANPRPPQGGLDLTFVCVDWLGLPLLNSSLPAQNVRAGDELQLIRSDAGKAFSGAVDTGSDASVIRTTFKGIEGMSGSPVVTPAGVVGLYLGSTGAQTGGRVLPMSVIKESAQRAMVPWELITNEFFDCNRTRRVCVTVDQGVTPATAKLESLFRPGTASVTPGACVEIPEGKYQIRTAATACEPQTVSVVSADAPLQVKLQCAPALGGTWRTRDGDWFMCVDKGTGEATCSGLNSLGNGVLQATLSAKGAKVSVLGSFISANGIARPATGDLRWTPGLLSGEVRREQHPPKTIELHREETP